MNCIECGKSFIPKTYNQKYCSQLCNGRAKHKRYRTRQPICICKTCGKEFHKRFNAKGFYCSRECSFLDKENNPMFIAHKIMHERALVRKEEKEAEKALKKIERQQRAIAKREAYILDHTIECRVCGKTFLSKYNSKFCSDECRKIWANGRYDRRIKKNGKPDYSINLKRLYKRFDGICQICGVSCDYNDYRLDDNGYFITGNMYPSVDHIKPIAKGGLHTWDNVQLAHMKCNSKKRDKHDDELPAVT